jgi:hypothetical protein
MGNEIEDGSELGQRRQDVQPDRDVLLDVREFVDGQCAGFLEHMFANPDLAHVMQVASQPHLFNDFFGEIQLRGDGCGYGGDAVRVATQIRALGLHRIDEGLSDTRRYSLYVFGEVGAHVTLTKRPDFGPTLSRGAPSR